MKLTGIMNQTDLTDMCRIFHLNTKEYSFFSAPHWFFFKIDHAVCHKSAQQQQNYQKACTLMETEQLPTDWLLNQGKNKGIKEVLEFQENEGTTYSSLWNTMKAVWGEKFIALSTFIKK